MFSGRTLASTGIVSLNQETFASYESSLQEINIFSAKRLIRVDSGSFRRLTRLHTLYVQHAPLLVNLSADAFGSQQLKSVRIKQSGLQSTPCIRSSPSDSNIIDIIDFDNNRIRRLQSYSVSLRVNQLSLEYNVIEAVEDFAFNGSLVSSL